MGHTIERSFISFNFMGPRGEVLSKNNVRLEVNSVEKKNFFHRKAPESFSVECGESGEFL